MARLATPIARRRSLAAALASLLMATGPGDAREAQPLRSAVVSDVRVLPTELPGSEVLRELSGLAIDQASGHLLGITDRGVFIRWRVAADSGRFLAVDPVLARRLSSTHRVNGESIEALQLPAADGAVALVVDEHRHEVVRLDAAGAVLGTDPLPAALAPADGRNRNSGVEGIALHPRHGLLASTQRGSATGLERVVHRIHASDGRTWAFRATAGVRSTVKALHLLDPRRLLVLEKGAADGTLHHFLREIDLDGCANETPCAPASVAVRSPALLPRDNFEGLACLDTTWCVLGSDDGALGRRRTVLALVRLVRE